MENLTSTNNMLVNGLSCLNKPLLLWRCSNRGPFNPLGLKKLMLHAFVFVYSIVKEQERIRPLFLLQKPNPQL